MSLTVLEIEGEFHWIDTAVLIADGSGTSPRANRFPRRRNESHVYAPH